MASVGGKNAKARYSASVGIGTSKFIAKIASETGPTVQAPTLIAVLCGIVLSDRPTSVFPDWLRC